MNIKKTTYVLLVIGILFLIKIGYADAVSSGTIHEGARINFNGTSVTSTDNENYPWFHYKYSNSSAYFCASGLNVTASIGASCDSTSWGNQKDSIAVAYIINSITGSNNGSSSFNISFSNTTDTSKYYWIEILSLYYLGKYTPSEGSYINTNVISNSSYKLPNGKSFMETINSANSYATKYLQDVSVNLSTNSLDFTLNESDNYYYSQNVVITNENNNANVSVNHSNSKFELLTDGNTYFRLRIKKSDVLGTKLSDKVTVSATNDYYTSTLYNCGGDYQKLISTITSPNSKSNSKLATGSVELTKLVVNKKDENNKFLPGAVIKIENEDKSYSKTFTTTNTALTIEGLAYGKYTITEVTSPKKYLLNNSPQTVTISSTKLSESVNIVNKLTKVEISKLNIVDGSLLKGAKLQIEDENGKVLYTWESDGKVYIVNGLESGKYYLVETSAPEGFELNKEKVEFTVDGKTEIVKVKMENTLKVEVPDTLSSRSALLLTIAMLDISLGIGILTYVKKYKIKD